VVDLHHARAAFYLFYTLLSLWSVVLLLLLAHPPHTGGTGTERLVRYYIVACVSKRFLVFGGGRFSLITRYDILVHIIIIQN
jgi:hypothetical protein